MSKDYIKDFDATPVNNSDIGGVNIAENCPAANINNAIRQLMTVIKAGDWGTVGPKADTISESTAAAGVTVDGVLLKDGSATFTAAPLTDAISEKTSAAGVTVDGVQLKDGVLQAGAIESPTTGGTSTAYTVTNTAPETAYVSGRAYMFTTNVACGASPTVNIDGLGAKALKKFSAGSKVALAANDLPSGFAAITFYDGTDMILVNLPSSALRSYDSGNQTITASGSLTLAHGLGEKPKVITCYIKNTSAQLGYVLNDEVVVAPNSIFASTDGFSLWADATNIYVRFASGGTETIIRNVSAFDAAGVTSANWAFLVRAYA